jgi:tyrosyl-tRNA synthetase
MEFKLALALEIVTLVHGVEMADEAREYFRATVQDRQIPTDLKLVSGATALEVAVNYFGETKSRGDIKRLFAQGAVSVNEVKISDLETPVKSGDAVQMGKRDWAKIM